MKRRGKILIRRCEKFILLVQRVPVWVWLTGITLVSFLLKLLSWHFDPEVSRDGCLYIYFSQIWYDTGSFQGVINEWESFWLPPLPLYLIKSIMHTGLSAEIAGVLLNLAAGTVTPILTYIIAYETTQRKDISLCSALLITVHPAMNALSVEVQRDMIYLFFAGVTLCLLTAGVRRQKWSLWCWAGLACSCAMLTRFETAEFLVIVPLSLLLLLIRKTFSWKKAVCYAGLFFLCFSGGLFALSYLMQTQNYLIGSYERYYSQKTSLVKEQVIHDFEEPEN